MNSKLGQKQVAGNCSQTRYDSRIKVSQKHRIYKNYDIAELSLPDSTQLTAVEELSRPLINCC